MHDWDATLYSRFSDLRLRPALDLLTHVPSLPEGPVVDLGCGTGVVGPALRQRFPDRPLIGVDTSPAMLERAGTSGVYSTLIEADVSVWRPNAPAALIYSNAALQWLPDHGTLFPSLAEALVPGGVLAVQMPRQYGAPSHRLIRDIAARLFPDRFDWTDWKAPVGDPAAYYRLLAPFGAVTVWETEYVQALPPDTSGHPVAAFTRSTIMRPVLDKLAEDEVQAFLTVYRQALEAAYPAEPDGCVLFPFRRSFILLKTA